MPDLPETLLAVAVHDDAEARLEPTEVDEVRVRSGESPAFRVSYRMADSPQRRERANLVVAFRVDGGAWSRQEASMRDRPLRQDERLGDITFRVGSLETGPHVLEFQVDFDVSDQALAAGAPTVATQSRLEGRVSIVVE